MALTAERLRNDDRFTGENFTEFLLFLPLGICLFVCRIILALILWVASIIMPNKSTVRQMLSTLACCTFGVYVKVKGQRDPRCSMLVANYASCLDSLAAAHALGTISLRKWKVPPFFASTLGIRNAAQFVRKEHFGGSAAPLLLQPEGGPGAGAGALLRFAHWPCPPAPRVQPLAIEVSRLFTRVTVQRAGAGAGAGFPWRDALWFLVSPVTVYTLTLLPPVAAPPDRVGAQLARVIADHLQVEATDIEYSALSTTARASAQASSASDSAGASASRELARRAQQVKEVLPRVPLQDIMRDLAITRSVDVTVTNFLEGVTPYTAESAAAAVPSPSPARSAPAPAPAPAPASFHERKQQMIAEARRRYIDKHGLDLAATG